MDVFSLHVPHVRQMEHVVASTRRNCQVPYVEWRMLGVDCRVLYVACLRLHVACLMSL